MEEGAPLEPSSGGTPTAMVAVPMLNTALGQQLSIFGGTGVGTKMEASIHLRAKDFAASSSERWCSSRTALAVTGDTAESKQPTSIAATFVRRIKRRSTTREHEVDKQRAQSRSGQFIQHRDD